MDSYLDALAQLQRRLSGQPAPPIPQAAQAAQGFFGQPATTAAPGYGMPIMRPPPTGDRMPFQPPATGSQMPVMNPYTGSAAPASGGNSAAGFMNSPAFMQLLRSQGFYGFPGVPSFDPNSGGF